MKQNLRFISAVLFLLSAGTGLLPAFDGLDIHGDLINTGLTDLEDPAGSTGWTTELVLTLEGRPEEGFGFRAEGGLLLQYGLENLPARIWAAGLELPPGEADLPQGTDLHRSLTLFQAYGWASGDRFSLQAGVLPLSWGTAWLYNPTSRTTAPGFPGENLERAEGRPGISLTLSLPAGLSLEGYVLAAPRLADPVPELEETAPDRFPLGGRLVFRTGPADLSAGVCRELMTGDSEPALWFTADAAGYLGDLNWYAEGALGRSEAEAAAGFWYPLPLVNTDLRCEYLYLGGGSSGAAEYDTPALLAGTRTLLARNYLYAGLEKEDAAAGRWSLILGTLINLDDGSLLASGEFLWKNGGWAEYGLFLQVPLTLDSREDSPGEFGGLRPVGPGVDFRPYLALGGFTVRWTL